ncbi:hypothetical protein N7492_009889 [Penicillium capsulatum]|uniref:DUF7703 domain-containing protein n=1 Tax=Penicillium capsulatum TaxID=69766 RepID=A0A9W9HMF5_9EURO|nr:hypothetical protein N7492_009889 [Penicillium capsulatum]KAJ6112400.1 hypothetical protein N7512_007724 [Penicillium capsulatum]
MVIAFVDDVTAGTALPMGHFVREDTAVVPVVCMFAIGAYNALETGIATLDCFKHYRGFYFWSMQIASWGTLLHTISASLSYVRSVPAFPISVPFLLGWVCMVTGQAIVLYSRLHLLVTDTRLLRWVLGMIFTDSFLLHAPMIVLFYCSKFGLPASIQPAQVFGHVQVTGFCLQDLIISGIYIYESPRALTPLLKFGGRDGRRVICHLILANVLVVCLDIAVLVIEFQAEYLEISFNALVYSIKLKVEFMVLTRLRTLTRAHPCICHGESDKPRRSSDINIFDMMASRSRIMGIDTPPNSPAYPPPSFRSSTHDFHQALREVASPDRPVSPLGTRSLDTEYGEEKDDPRSRVGSADTRSAVEMNLLHSSK